MDITKHHEKRESTNPFVICDDFIKMAQNAYIFGKDWREKFDVTLRLMFDTIQTLEKDEELEDFKYTEIEECLNFLNSMTVEKPASTDLSEFIHNFIYLAHNINLNTYKYEGVTRKIAYLQRYCDGALTYSETISLMKTVSKRVERWREWAPPSFRLSGHYYQLIKED